MLQDAHYHSFVYICTMFSRSVSNTIITLLQNRVLLLRLKPVISFFFSLFFYLRPIPASESTQLHPSPGTNLEVIDPKIPSSKITGHPSFESLPCSSSHGSLFSPHIFAHNALELSLTTFAPLTQVPSETNTRGLKVPLLILRC